MSTRLLDNLFIFRGSEKGLKEDPLCFGSPEGEVKMILHHENEAQTHNQDKTNNDSRAYSH
jgi:hypothetical protein